MVLCTHCLSCMFVCLRLFFGVYVSYRVGVWLVLFDIVVWVLPRVDGAMVFVVI